MSLRRRAKEPPGPEVCRPQVRTSVHSNTRQDKRPPNSSRDTATISGEKTQDANIINFRGDAVVAADANRGIPSKSAVAKIMLQSSDINANGPGLVVHDPFIVHPYTSMHPGTPRNWTLPLIFRLHESRLRLPFTLPFSYRLPTIW